MAPDLVVERDPALPLLAVAEAPPSAQLEQRQHLLQRATLRREHDAGAQVGDPDCRRPRPASSAASHCDAHVGEEAGARRDCSSSTSSSLAP